MTRRTGNMSVVFAIIWLSVLPGIQMSINLKDKLSLSSTSTNPNYPVFKTTDGIYGPFDDGVCMASNNASTVYWRGEFTGLARIQRIDIVFRIDERADGYQFWISNGTSVPSGIKCYEDVESGYPDLIQNITSCNISGETLIMYITRTSGDAFMDVCEVDVYGCFSHKFGDQCQNSCNCKHGCDPDIGVCDSPYCNAGWSGARFCNQPCSQVTFGENCLQKCHCKTPGCNSQNGTCLVSGCRAGYSGLSCSQACINTTFGENCSSKCHCDIVGCDSVTGHCTVHGCAAGWKGETCSKSCSEGEFGKGCIKLCHCAEPGCDKANGICTNPDKGCLDGWNGTTCSQECVAPYFGNKCASRCRCRTLGCNHIHGTCTVPGCQDGWMARSCSKQCPESRFGRDCLLTCHCKTPGCSRFNGTCTSPDGCSDGYVGITCSTQCKPGYFGANCTKQCHCKDTGCSHVTGNCSASGCLPGYTGETCSEQCPRLMYGQGCNFTCGHCINMTVCHHSSGECEFGCTDGYYGKACHSESPDWPVIEPSSGIGGVIGGVVGTCVVAIVTAVAIILLKRRHDSAMKNKYRESAGDITDDTTHKENNPRKKILNEEDGTRSNLQCTENIALDDEENIYMNHAVDVNDIDLATPISVKHFRATVETKEADGQLEKEYQTLPYGAVHPHEEGKKEFNVPKNRFISTFPYDHSRVILTDRQADPGSDYINANYIDGISRPKAYIALQGPKKKTIEAFWTMIWQQKCHTIVMLTNLYENGRNKCHQYWPDVDGHMNIGEFAVHLDTEKEYAFYVKRVMVLKHGKIRQERQVCQFHYTKWPDHDIPDVFELVMFHRHIQRSRIPEDGPLAVHCSAGIGRTGTLIALDSLLEAGKKGESIDVREYVMTMRRDRMNMVQTVSQYKVIHLALIEGLNFPDNLQTKEDLIGYEEPGLYEVPANQTQLNKEYQTLQEINTASEKRLKYDTAKSAENRGKNRNMEILAADNYKAHLLSEMPTGNYINAIKVPGFRYHLRYLVTQFPLRDTMVDFWTLVTDFGAKTIVCLGAEKEIQWWPAKSMVKYTETFEIRTISADTCTDDISTSLLNIKDKKNGNKTLVKLFQVSNLAKDASIPTSDSVLCKLHYLVEAWLMSQEEGPVVVTCLDGANHSGLYCLISTMLERLDSDADVDMYATARQLQIRRPQFVATLDQYRYAWTAVKSYVQTTGNDECAEEAVYQNTS